MAAVEHTMVSGQSLAVGHSGLPAISTTTEYAAAKEGLHDGTLVALQVGQDPAQSGDQPTRQRPEFSLGYRLHEARVASAQTVMSTDGQGGSTVAQLSKGGSTGEFEQVVDRVQQIRTARVAAGDTYAARALHWIQGESDQALTTTTAAWVTALTAYRTDLLADAGLASLPFIVSQTSTQDFLWDTATHVPRICLAQLQMHRTLPWFTLVGPHYQVPRAVDDLHLNGVGYYRLGEYHARASLAEINGAGWSPLMPTGVTYAAQQITVTFNVPVPPLAIDTTMVAAQPNYGFSLHDTAALITAVTVNTTTVVIDVDRPITGSARVGYAVGPTMDTGRGNLRDSETATSVYDGAQLANWSVLFLESFTPAGPQVIYRVRKGRLLLVRSDGSRAELIF